jgi:hypothetical protein
MRRSEALASKATVLGEKHYNFVITIALAFVAYPTVAVSFRILGSSCQDACVACSLALLFVRFEGFIMLHQLSKGLFILSRDNKSYKTLILSCGTNG